MSSHILVVEDDPDQRQLSCEILSRGGYTVASAADGNDARRRLRINSADLILLDVSIPHMSGIELCEEIRRNPDTRLIPVILITALSDNEARLHGIQAGADDFLTKPINPIELMARIRSLLLRKEYVDELERSEHVLMALGASIEARDAYTEGHCERIARYSVAFGKQLGLNTEQLRALNIGGSVHDIGKVAVPDFILLKSGPLLPTEWTILRGHSAAGERICAPLRSFPLVLPIIRHHHEKQDGSGYPDGLRGDNVPVLAQVMQIVDIFDALTTDRPYRRRLSYESALAKMAEEVHRGWWNEELFNIFLPISAQLSTTTNGVNS